MRYIAAGDSSDGDSANVTYTLSIIGYSLGGIYGRQALAGIDWNITDGSSTAASKLIPMIFLTLCTPHLGESRHTYLPLPRAMEFVIAQVMQQSGKDLFRFTPVLEDLIHKREYLLPLSTFRQRIAYANVFATDFQVPTATAAFWANGSDSLHYRVSSPVLASTPGHDNDVGRGNATSAQREVDAITGDSFSPSSSPSAITRDTHTPPKAIVQTLSTPRRLDGILNSYKDSNEKEINEDKNQYNERNEDDTNNVNQEQAAITTTMEGGNFLRHKFTRDGLSD